VGIHTETPAMPLHVLTGGGSANRYAIRIQNMSVPSNVWDIGVDNESPDTDLLFAYKGTYKAAIDEDGTYQKGSDKALKKNIKALAPALEKVMKLKPCTYQYKASVTGRTNIGMIAQEVEKYFPQVVRKKEFYTLDYNGFGVIAIKAIQEQQELINQLKKEIKEIKKSIG
ncbi:MAG: tail fiber domain-containing protein, partial [Bacteroidota bacterium]